MKNIIAAVLLALTIQAGFAQKNLNIKRIGESTFAVGTYAKPFAFERVQQHEGENNDLHWDWATCIMMTLNYQGLNVSQEQVMSLVNGRPEAPTSTPPDLIFAVNKSTPHAWGKPSRVYTSMANLNADVLFDELSAGRPLILATGTTGMEGRALVVTAMTYTIKFDASGNQTGITPTTVILRDPWPSAMANRTVNWADFAQLTASLYTVKVEFAPDVTK